VSGLIQAAAGIWERVKGSRARLPTRLAIPPERVDRGAALGTPFDKDGHYFLVRVNELFLAYERQWTSTYDPLVFSAVEFTYGKEETAVPFVVGPAQVERGASSPTPEGMLFNNTTVAGWYPYRGGELTLAIVLCRVRRQNYATSLLRLVENAAGALNFATQLGAYLKLAGVVLGGVDALLGQSEDTTPLVGQRFTLSPTAGDSLRPGYYALIDADEGAVDARQLWVRENALVSGPSLAEARPFRQADYVLYSIAQTAARDDERLLPFYPQYERVLEEATKTKEKDDEAWKSASANMVALWQTLVLSPDLIPAQRDALIEGYAAEMKRVRERTLTLGSLGGPEHELDPATEAKLLDAVSLLDD
jgi:hypothetical protein